MNRLRRHLSHPDAKYYMFLAIEAVVIFWWEYTEEIDWSNVTLRAYKTKLVVNNRENNILRQCAGKARFVFNWGLAEWKRQYEAGEKPSAYALK